MLQVAENFFAKIMALYARPPFKANTAGTLKTYTVGVRLQGHLSTLEILSLSIVRSLGISCLKLTYPQ